MKTGEVPHTTTVKEMKGTDYAGLAITEKQKRGTGKIKNRITEKYKRR